MQTYGQNTRYPIGSIGLNISNVQTITSLPVGGYTLTGLENFLPKNLTQLRSLLTIANEDVGITIDAFIEEEKNRVQQGGIGSNSNDIISFLQAISADIQKSINNIDITLRNQPEEVIVLPAGKPIISVKGINFDEVQLGNTSILPIVIENTGNDLLIVNGYTGFGAESSYSVLSPYQWPDITQNSPIQLQPGETKSLDISFSPNAIVNFTANIKFTSNANEGTNAASIRGIGKAIPDQNV